MTQYAEQEWQRAQRSLSSAKQLIEHDPDSSASRAYYAVFHALTALFALRGQSFTKHSAIRAALHRDLVQTKQWPVELGQAYDFLLDLRETGDYGGATQVDAEDAAMAVGKAERFLAAVRETCPELR